jgi:hypothetical protein
MFGLTKLLHALTTLADNLSALASTVAEVNGGMRRRLLPPTASAYRKRPP